MREKFLKNLAHWHTTYPWRIFSVVVLLTIIFAFFTSQLKQTMRWSDLLPSGDPRTVQFNKIINEFVSSTSIIVVVQGGENRIKQFADELAPRLTAAIDTGTGRKLIQRVDYKTEVDFRRNYGLMLLKENDLKNLGDIYTDPNITGLLYNINNAMEKEYVGREESISTREREDHAVSFLDGVQNLIHLTRCYLRGENVPGSVVFDGVDKLLIGEPYLLSYDKKALIMNAIPNFNMFDADLLVRGTDTIQGVVDDLLKDYPDVNAGLTGMIPVGRDEIVYSSRSLGYTTLIAVIAILAMLIFAFRMWVAPVLAMLNLLVGIVWAMGTAAIVVGQLNIMTSMMAVILLGLGIDFSIHLISGFTEWRAAGDSIGEAMEKTFLKSGAGILTGALTTAFAFLTMMISSSRGMKEMGLVTGTGLLAILFATFLFLPVMLVLRERRLDKKRDRNPGVKNTLGRDISFRFLGYTGEWMSRHYVFTIIGGTIITALLFLSARNITFDKNYLNCEAKGLVSVALNDTIQDKFDLSMSYALVLADDVKQSRELAEKYRDLASVAMTEDISIYLPSAEQQHRRIPYIKKIRRELNETAIRPGVSVSELPALKEQIERLQMNIMEMQDMAFLGGQDKVDNKCGRIVGNPDDHDSENIIQQLLRLLAADSSAASARLSKFQNDFSPYFKTAANKICSTRTLSLRKLPVSILDRYTNKTRDQFLTTVFPAGEIWQDSDLFYRFTDDLARVSDRATGFPPVFRALINIFARDGRNSALLTLVIIFLLLWADFRSIRYSLIAMIPLAAGVVWMIGIMRLTGQQITVVNIMGLPMILGIGIDDGVHIVHRWLMEGKGNIRAVFASTGKAILLTSLTTMLAFGSLIFSVWRGFAHLGAALFVGVGTCFLTTVIILAGIMGLIEKKKIEGDRQGDKKSYNHIDVNS